MRMILSPTRTKPVVDKAIAPRWRADPFYVVICSLLGTAIKAPISAL